MSSTESNENSPQPRRARARRSRARTCLVVPDTPPTTPIYTHRVGGPSRRSMRFSFGDGKMERSRAERPGRVLTTQPIPQSPEYPSGSRVVVPVVARPTPYQHSVLSRPTSPRNGPQNVFRDGPELLDQNLNQPSFLVQDTGMMPKNTGIADFLRDDSEDEVECSQSRSLLMGVSEDELPCAQPRLSGMSILLETPSPTRDAKESLPAPPPFIHHGESSSPDFLDDMVEYATHPSTHANMISLRERESYIFRSIATRIRQEYKLKDYSCSFFFNSDNYLSMISEEASFSECFVGHIDLPTILPTANVQVEKFASLFVSCDSDFHKAKAVMLWIMMTGVKKSYEQVSKMWKKHDCCYTFLVGDLITEFLSSKYNRNMTGPPVRAHMCDRFHTCDPKKSMRDLNRFVPMHSPQEIAQFTKAFAYADTLFGYMSIKRFLRGYLTPNTDPGKVERSLLRATFDRVRTPGRIVMGFGSTYSSGSYRVKLLKTLYSIGVVTSRAQMHDPDACTGSSDDMLFPMDCFFRGDNFWYGNSVDAVSLLAIYLCPHEQPQAPACEWKTGSDLFCVDPACARFKLTMRAYIFEVFEKLYRKSVFSTNFEMDTARITLTRKTGTPTVYVHLRDLVRFFASIVYYFRRKFLSHIDGISVDPSCVFRLSLLVNSLNEMLSEDNALKSYGYDATMHDDYLDCLLSTWIFEPSHFLMG